MIHDLDATVQPLYTVVVPVMRSSSPTLAYPVFCYALQFLIRVSLVPCNFLIVSSLPVVLMDPSNLNLDGLTFSEDGLTLNLQFEPETAAILEHCLIGRVLTDREIQFAYFSERMSRAWKPGKRVAITKSMSTRYLFQFHHKVDGFMTTSISLWIVSLLVLSLASSL